jgi:hypothetical protein
MVEVPFTAGALGGTGGKPFRLCRSTREARATAVMLARVANRLL